LVAAPSDRAIRRRIDLDGLRERGIGNPFDLKIHKGVGGKCGTKGHGERHVRLSKIVVVYETSDGDNSLSPFLRGEGWGEGLLSEQ
jgi:hypothetical protein